MEVWSSDGEKLGKVVMVHADALEIEQGVLFKKELVASFDDLTQVREGRIYLSRTRKELGEGGGLPGALGGEAGAGVDRKDQQGDPRRDERRTGIGG
jgi:hypothetical protein